jgi:hypothetical protein
VKGLLGDIEKGAGIKGLKKVGPPPEKSLSERIGGSASSAAPPASSASRSGGGPVTPPTRPGGPMNMGDELAARLAKRNQS